MFFQDLPVVMYYCLIDLFLYGFSVFLQIFSTLRFKQFFNCSNISYKHISEKHKQTPSTIYFKNLCSAISDIHSTNKLQFISIFENVCSFTYSLHLIHCSEIVLLRTFVVLMSKVIQYFNYIFDQQDFIKGFKNYFTASRCRTSICFLLFYNKII